MKISDVSYSPSPMAEIRLAADELNRYSRLAAEFGHSATANELLDQLRQQITSTTEKFTRLVETPVADPDEPEGLEEIRGRRSSGVRRILSAVPSDYQVRWRGSILGRSAGCTLGAAVEFNSVEQMEHWAEYFNEPYPPVDYFQRIKEPGRHRYIVGTINDVTRGRMSFVPADDDTAYTLIGLLTLEAFGPNFRREQQALLWQKNFPLTSEENGSWGAYWGERAMLLNLQKGVPAALAGYRNNPNVQSIAAWTRADSWGYAAPGWPEKAAELAYKDASINHRRNGVYGAMFFAATIAAAFAVDDPVEALKIGLQEIPEGCLLAEGLRWAIDVAPTVSNYKDAAQLVRDRYPEMFEGHAVNNALQVVFGIFIGRKDFTKVIGETVAMGLDNDCTGATAGSIVGAVIGEPMIPKHWTDCFQHRLQTYLKDFPRFVTIDDLGVRFEAQAQRIHSKN